MRHTDPLSIPFSWVERLTSLLAPNPSMVHAPRDAVEFLHPSILIPQGPAILVALLYLGSAEQPFTGVTVRPRPCAWMPTARKRTARKLVPNMMVSDSFATRWKEGASGRHVGGAGEYYTGA